jgi:hypothetical protein
VRGIPGALGTLEVLGALETFGARGVFEALGALEVRGVFEAKGAEASLPAAGVAVPTMRQRIPTKEAAAVFFISVFTLMILTCLSCHVIPLPLLRGFNMTLSYGVTPQSRALLKTAC